MEIIFITMLFVACSQQAPPFQSFEKGGTPNNLQTVMICNGGRRSIQCPSLQLLHIKNAFYGKLSGHDCQQPLRTVRDQIPTCLSKDASKIIKETCQDQQSCDLYAEDGLYNNPCPSVEKYMFVSYTCQGKSRLPETLAMYEKEGKFGFNIPSVEQMYQKKPGLAPASLRHETPPGTPMSAVVCSGQTGSIGCPFLQLINIHQAFFGKAQGRDCSGRLTRDSIPTCFAKDAYSIIKDTCQGQQSCDLYSEPQLYGRTMCKMGTDQYLHVSYSCQGHTDLQNRLTAKDKGRAFIYPYYTTQGKLPQLQQIPVTRQDLAKPIMVPKYPWMLRPAHPLVNRPVARSFPGYPTGFDVNYPGVQAAAQAINPCDQCNGDCRNYLCYGCGGCVEPPPAQQTYYYPYQRQDAAYHDAFAGNEMALSGMVIYPVPKPRVAPKSSTRSNINKDSEQDDDSDDDADDSEDDDDDDSKKKDKIKTNTSAPK